MNDAPGRAPLGPTPSTAHDAARHVQWRGSARSAGGLIGSIFRCDLPPRLRYVA